MIKFCSFLGTFTSGCSVAVIERDDDFLVITLLSEKELLHDMQASKRINLMHFCDSGAAFEATIVIGDRI